MNHKYNNTYQYIEKYLKGICTRDFIINPNMDLQLEHFADTNFTEICNIENTDDPAPVKSRLG